MARYEVFVTYKEGVYDPPGTTAERALANLGYEDVNSVKIGKYIQIDADVDLEAVRGICEELLANPVIEDFRILTGEEA